jgi:ribosomal protein L40E
LSGLTKKAVYVDRLLSTILGVSEGDLVSYADLSKGLHKYIKDNKLKNPSAKKQTISQPIAHAAEPPTVISIKQCRDCGAEIPFEAVFCDMCGMSQ